MKQGQIRKIDEPEHVRQTGRTTRIIEQALQVENSVFFVYCHNEVKRIEDQYPKLRGRVEVYRGKGSLRGLARDSVFLDHLIQDYFDVPDCFHRGYEG